MLPKYATYITTKGAVEQITRVLGKELGGRGIRVNVISPGSMDTELYGEKDNWIRWIICIGVYCSSRARRSCAPTDSSRHRTAVIIQEKEGALNEFVWEKLKKIDGETDLEYFTSKRC